MALQLPWVPFGGTPCCCPTDCCLYPWPDPDGVFGGPLYPDTDLPDNVVVTTTGYTYNATGLVLSRSGYVYSGSDGNDWEVTAILTGQNFWRLRVRPSGETDWIDLFGGGCLIVDEVGELATTIVADQFSNTYLFTGGSPYPPGTTCTITRTGPCCWEGTLEYINEFGEPVSVPISICYKALPEDSPTKYGWFEQDGSGFYYQKEDPQSSPVGNYSHTPFPDPPDYTDPSFVS